MLEFDMVEFFGIIIILTYLMQNPVHTYILNIKYIYDLQTHFVDDILERLGAFLYSVK